jgi:hypothetical protein
MIMRSPELTRKIGRLSGLNNSPQITFPGVDITLWVRLAAPTGNDHPARHSNIMPTLTPAISRQ